MGARIGGIILLVIGLGVALYFINSGGAAKFGSVFTPPGNASTTVATSSVSVSSTTTPISQATSSGNAFFNFLSQLFHPLPATLPSSGGGAGGNGNGGGMVGGGSVGIGTSGATGVANTSSIPAYEIPPGYTAAQISPSFHQVRLGAIGTQEISLYTYATYNQPTTTIDLTGWEIKTNRGGEYVPQIVNLYNPSGAPVLSDLIILTTQNNTINFYTNSAPQNVRLNECMGYLNQTNQFNPPLPYSCPQVDRSAITNFTGACQNYILSLGCQPVDMSNPQIPRNDYACQQYLENNFTYSSCIANHDHDPNFLGNEWHIWMGLNSSPIDPSHDNVVLLDKNGLVVDYYGY